MKLSIFKNAHAIAPDALDRIQAQKGKLGTQSTLLALALISDDVKDAHGVDVQYCVTPNENLLYVYIGLYGLGHVATYTISDDMWSAAQSHGNYGNNIASGGTWTTTKRKLRNPPKIVDALVTALLQAAQSKEK